MGKVFIKSSNEVVVNLQPIFEIEHHSKIVNNTQYAINAVHKAISRGQLTIELNKSNLTKKVFIGTSCYLFDRNGNPLKVAIKPPKDEESKDEEFNIDDLEYVTIVGKSNPQYGDKFSKLEGRKYALSNALSNMKLVTNDPNFDDLLRIKRFLQTYELQNKSTPVSYQLMDLWLAVVAQIHPSVEYRAANYIGKDEFNNKFESLLGKDKQNIVIEFIINVEKLETRLSLVEIYSLFKSIMFDMFNVY